MSPSVLVVEDYLDLCTMITDTLVEREFECDHVHSSEDAIAKLRKRHYSAILLSPHTPVDEDPVMHFLHEQQPEELQKVIIMAEPGTVVGKDEEMLSKPFNREQLFASINRTLVR